MPQHDFHVFVGSQTGYFKGINLNQEAIITKNFTNKESSQNGIQQITAMSWNDISEVEIMVGFQNQNIAIFDTTSNCFSWSHSLHFGEGSLVSVFRKSGCIIAGLDSGEVTVVQHRQSTVINTIARNYSDKYTKKPTLCCVKPDLLSTSQFATGGCENDLALWDMNNSKVPIFRAKNVKADMLELRVPIWVTGLTYLPNSNLIATSSRHMHVRLYDPKAQRKPVINFEWESNPLTCIAAVPSSERQTVVGTNHGRMALFDLRRVTSKTPVCVYKGFVGAVRSVVVGESSPHVFSVSLDRCLRVHELQRGKIVCKHFLKSRLNCLLVRKDVKNDFQLSENNDIDQPRNVPKNNKRRAKNSS